jgi:hypothetical protein
MVGLWIDIDADDMKPGLPQSARGASGPTIKIEGERPLRTSGILFPVFFPLHSRYTATNPGIARVSSIFRTATNRIRSVSQTLALSLFSGICSGVAALSPGGRQVARKGVLERTQVIALRD